MVGVLSFSPWLYKFRQTKLPYLEGDAADGEVATVFQHVEVLRYEGSTVDQTVCSFSMVSSLWVLSSHVL